MQGRAIFEMPNLKEEVYIITFHKEAGTLIEKLSPGSFVICGHSLSSRDFLSTCCKMNTDAEAAENIHPVRTDLSLQGKTYQVWSLMSRSGDQYICKTMEVTSTGFVANATGTANGPLPIAVHFKIESPGDIWCRMVFVTNHDRKYRLSGTSSGVSAVPAENSPIPDEEIWKPVKLTGPANIDYYAFQSKKKENGKDMYLSSDGAGKLTVKQANSPTGIKPFKNNPWIDVSLLFRAVEPTS